MRGERGMDTTWMPYMWPIKTCLLVGIVFLYMTTGFLQESIMRGERGMDTTWMPYMWPIKTCLLIGIIFLLVQGISELLKSYWAAKKGIWPGDER